MLRLAPNLHASAESSLSDGNADNVARLLSGVVEADHPSVDALRLLALAARQRGHEEQTRGILDAARIIAMDTGDLVGATDAIRRLDILGEDTADAWQQLQAHIQAVGFATTPQPLTWVNPPPAREEDDIDAIFSAAAELKIRHSTPDELVPFDPIPVLSHLPVEELMASLRSVQLRVILSGTELRETISDTIAWVTSGKVRINDQEVALRAGTMLTPEGSEACASGPVRLLCIARDECESLLETPAARQAFCQAERGNRLATHLRALEFYRLLSPEARETMLPQMDCIALEDGATILTQGRTTTGLFLLLQGELRVLDTVNGSAREIHRIQPGELFGELEALTGGVAEFEVRADDAVEMAHVPGSLLRDLLGDEPAAREHLVALVGKRHERFAQTS